MNFLTAKSAVKFGPSLRAVRIGGVCESQVNRTTFFIDKWSKY